MYAIEIKSGLLKDNATGCPVTFYRWTDAFITVLTIIGKGHKAKVITYEEKVNETKDTQN